MRNLNLRNIKIRLKGLHRRFDTEPMQLVYYINSLIQFKYNNISETNETEKTILTEQVEAMNQYIAFRTR